MEGAGRKGIARIAVVFLPPLFILVHAVLNYQGYHQVSRIPEAQLAEWHKQSDRCGNEPAQSLCRYEAIEFYESLNRKNALRHAAIDALPGLVVWALACFMI